jgi:hypothetical protein
VFTEKNFIAKRGNLGEGVRAGELGKPEGDGIVEHRRLLF